MKRIVLAGLVPAVACGESLPSGFRKSRRFVVTSLVILATGIVGCATPPDNICPSSIIVRVDTASSLSSWGSPKSTAAAALNEVSAECVPLRFYEGAHFGAIRGYRIPVSVTVRGAIIDTVRYNAALASGGLSSSIRIDALGKSGAVLETATMPYHFVDTRSGIPVSGAVLVSQDEIGHVASVRVAWDYDR